jgi:hypothetical protein
MRNKIEILRAVCFSKDDIKTYNNLPFEFKNIEIEFMEEFKKIYELGLNQLERFIIKLDKDGNQLEPQDIQYYVKQLLNGPYSTYAAELGRGKKYFIPTTDNIGILRNNETTGSSTSLYIDDKYPIEIPTDILNKTPLSIQNMIKVSTETVEVLFRSSLFTSIAYDNTLPIVDKKNQTRYTQEKSGAWLQQAHGNFNVKDAYYRTKMEPARAEITGIVRSDIGDERYRVYEDKKQFSPFNPYSNNGYSANFVVEKKITNGANTQVFKQDIYVNVIDDRNTKIVVNDKSSNKEFLPNTVSGQLSYSNKGKKREDSITNKLAIVDQALNIAEQSGLINLGQFGVNSRGLLVLASQAGTSSGRELLVNIGKNKLITVGRQILGNVGNQLSNATGGIIGISNGGDLGITIAGQVFTKVDGKIHSNVGNLLINRLGGQILNNTSDQLIDISGRTIATIGNQFGLNVNTQMFGNVAGNVLSNISSQLFNSNGRISFDGIGEQILNNVGGQLFGNYNGQTFNNIGGQMGLNIGNELVNTSGQLFGNNVSNILGINNISNNISAQIGNNISNVLGLNTISTNISNNIANIGQLAINRLSDIGANIARQVGQNIVNISKAVTVQIRNSVSSIVRGFF